MILDDLKTIVSQSDCDRIIQFVNDNRDEIKILFSNLENSTTNHALCRQLTLFLSRLPIDERNKNEIQFLFTSLAFYFKFSKKTALLSHCICYISDSILKYRLQAWHQYRTYTNRLSHVNRFDSYISILSKAVADKEEEYYDDILQDLHDYFVEFNHIEAFCKLFSNEALLSKYPLLVEYSKCSTHIDIRIESHEKIDKIYTPSEFTEQLFNEKFIDYIRLHEDTDWNEILLGYDRYTIRKEIIKFGQADFDSSFDKLNPSQIVKLYCYFNMRKHFFSSLYLFNKCSIFMNNIQRKTIIKLIDIGCGPATTGLAFMEYIITNAESPAKFDYYGVDRYNSMLEEAKNMMSNPKYTPLNHCLFVNNLRDIDTALLNKSDLILFNTSYLFSSDSLDEKDLAVSINNILNKTIGIKSFLLFQNTTDLTKNNKYISFKKIINKHTILFSENIPVKYNNNRNNFYIPKEENVYFEIIKF